MLHLPSSNGWASWTLPPSELAALAEAASQAWITRRFGCYGLVTRLILLDEREGPIGCVDIPRDPGEAEPVAWRVILLTALLAAGMERDSALGR